MKLKFSELIALSGQEIPDTEPVAPDALERIREHTMKQLKPHRHLSRRAVALLTAAAVFAALSITAGAVYLTVRASNRELMAAGPLTGGRELQQIDETAAAIIDSATEYLTIIDESKATTVTLESIMGFATEPLSVMYLTFNVDYPDDTVFNCTADDLGFVTQSLRFSDGLWPSGGGSSVAIINDDGTCSVMMMFEFEADLSNSSATLTLTDFGDVSEEKMHALYEGTASAEVSGEWSFTFDLSSLGAPNEIEFDAALFAQAKFQPLRIELCEFGGALTLEDDSVDLQTIALELRDGSVYQGVFRSFCEFNETTGELHYTHGFVFEVPQAIENAAALVIEGIRIPLN